MTKEQAIEFEKEIDSIFSERLEEKCEVSMALTGALRISVENGFFNIKTDTQTVDWVKWSGDYQVLQDNIRKSILAIRENKQKIDKLMESYRRV